MASPAIEVLSLSKHYDDPDGNAICAVSQASLCAWAGQVYGLLGPNGAGKTTTLRCLATILTPTEGTARVAGYDIRTQPEQVRRHLGFVSGTTGLYARLTPRETLVFFARLNGLAGEVLRDRVEATLRLFHVSEYADRPNDRLSTGMKQRVSLARALVHDPPVVILDEPTSGLDPVASQAVEETIVELKRAGKCVLLSTHMMYQAEELCDRIGVIGHGRVLADGAAGEILAQTRSRSLREAFLRLVGAGGADGVSGGELATMGVGGGTGGGAGSPGAAMGGAEAMGDGGGGPGAMGGDAMGGDVGATEGGGKGANDARR